MFTPENIFYFTGFWGESIAICTREGVKFFVPQLEVSRAETESFECEIFSTQRGEDSTKSLSSSDLLCNRLTVVSRRGRDRGHLRNLQEGVGGGLLARQRLPVAEPPAGEHLGGIHGGQLEAARQGGQHGGVRALGRGRGRPVIRSAAVVRARARRPGPRRGAPPRACGALARAANGRPGSSRRRPTYVARVRWCVMQEPLEQLLAQLHDAIEASEDGADNKDDIARLAGEVERRLGEDDPDGVVDDLREEVTRFEASHPNLAVAIGRAADALSAIGL